MKESLSTRLFSIISVAAFFSLTLFFFAPLQIYFTNTVEFQFTFFDVLPYLALPTIFSAIILSSLLILLKGKSYQKTISVLFILSVLVWVQGNILVWNYGPLDGVPIDWSFFWYRGVIDGILWLALIVISITRSEFIYKKLVRIVSVNLIIIQTAYSLFTFYPGYSTVNKSADLSDLPSFKR
jgi:hypothetical protein